MSELALFEAGTDRQQWCSAADKVMFRREITRDAREMGRALAMQPSNGIGVPQEDIYRCIGIEHLLSLQQARLQLQYRRNHIRTVLDAQNRCGEDKLCELSQQSSACSRERA